MRYIRAAAFGIVMMALIIGAGCVVLSLAAAFGAFAYHLGASKDVCVLVACFAALVILGAGIGIADMRRC